MVYSYSTGILQRVTLQLLHSYSALLQFMYRGQLTASKRLYSYSMVFQPWLNSYQTLFCQLLYSEQLCSYYTVTLQLLFISPVYVRRPADSPHYIVYFTVITRLLNSYSTMLYFIFGPADSLR